mmetsp:Transcript_6872/g.15662  ORF Transcript_6872/g.15662 Transcript_6872/m.15662 type:complete len:82 (-) Transcript_6872:707-952(-)
MLRADRPLNDRAASHQQKPCHISKTLTCNISDRPILRGKIGHCNKHLRCTKSNRVHSFAKRVHKGKLTQAWLISRLILIDH